VTTLGLGSYGEGATSIRVGMRSGILRYASVALGGVGTVGVVLAAFSILQRQPKEAFQLLGNWGVWWIVTLVLGYFAFTLAMKAVDHLGRLASGVQDTAVAMTRLAEKDDRERDRMITETAYVGQKVRAMAESMERIERHLLGRQEG
jgi:uncharacterized protein YacL